jgi:hypothetical protein
MSSFPQRDMAQLWRICAVFFLGFPFFCMLTPGAEPAEAVFKGVQFVQITLSRLQGDRKGIGLK